MTAQLWLWQQTINLKAFIRVFIWIYGRTGKSFLNLRTNSNIKEYVYALLQWPPACRTSVDWIILPLKSSNDRLLPMFWKLKFRILHFTHNLLHKSLHLTTPIIHDTMLSIKMNVLWCSAVSTMTSRWSIWWKSLETSVLMDTCTKSSIRKTWQKHTEEPHR